MVRRGGGGGSRKFLLEGGLIFNRGLEIIQKNVAWQKKGGEKTEGDFVTLNESEIRALV